jgi:hypothetical protein
VTEYPPHVLHEDFELPGVAAVGKDHQQAQEAVAKQAQS